MDEMRRVCGEERRNVSAAARTMCLERLGVVQSEIGGLALFAYPQEFCPAARRQRERVRGREGEGEMAAHPVYSLPSINTRSK